MSEKFEKEMLALVDDAADKRPTRKMYFISLPGRGGRLKRLNNRRGGPGAERRPQRDTDWSGDLVGIREKSQVKTVVTMSGLIGFNMEPAPILAACYAGGHITIVTSHGRYSDFVG